MSQLPQILQPSQLTKWKSLIDPLLANPLNGIQLLSNIVLKEGVNTINHGLGRTQQGWFPVDQQASATIYRSAPFNALTLQLTASAPVTVSLGVY